MDVKTGHMLNDHINEHYSLSYKKFGSGPKDTAEMAIATAQLLHRGRKKFLEILDLKEEYIQVRIVPPALS